MIKIDFPATLLEKVAYSHPELLVQELLDCYKTIEDLSEENDKMRKHIYELETALKSGYENPKEEIKIDPRIGSGKAGLNPDKDANKSVVFERHPQDEAIISKLFETLIG